MKLGLVDWQVRGVDGKTGGPWLIARHAAIEVLERLHGRQRNIQHLSFDDLLTQRCPHRVFRFGSGDQPRSFIGAFRRLWADAGLLADLEARGRSLYSLRHANATLALISGDIDIHALSRQMGTSVAMLERNHSKLTTTMVAKRLGWLLCRVTRQWGAGGGDWLTPTRLRAYNSRPPRRVGQYPI